MQDKFRSDRPAGSTLGAKVKRHCRRWWWLDILIVAIVTVLIVVPVIYVGIQRIVQKGINDSTAETILQSLRDPDPDSYQLGLDLVLRSQSPYRPNIDPFVGAFFLESTLPNIIPFAYVQFPSIYAADVIPVNISQRVQIADMEQFIEYNKIVLRSEVFRVASRGRTRVRLPGLPAYNVDFNKVTTVKGLNGLAGFSLSNVIIHNPPLDDGATMTGTVTIPNPSPIFIDMGNVTMSLLAKDGSHIGYTSIPNLIIKPQMNNTYSTRTYAPFADVAPHLENGILNIKIVGNTSVSSKGEHLEYFEQVLRSNEIEYSLNILEALAGSSNTTNATNTA